MTSQQKTLQRSRDKTNHKFTIGYTYFEEPHRLQEQMALWKKWPCNVDIFIVDDGSPNSNAYETLKHYPFEDWQPTLQLWKVPRDLGFNSHGCRNLIAKFAETDWIQFMDIDHLLYPSDVARLKRMKLEKYDLVHHENYSERYQRIRSHPGHLNHFAVHKEHFWEAGGYDESFTGHHYGDREFLERLYLTTKRKVKSNLILQCTREGRHGSVTNKVDKTEYISDDFFYAPMGIERIEKLKGTKKQRLDFPFIRIL